MTIDSCSNYYFYLQTLSSSLDSDSTNGFREHVVISSECIHDAGSHTTRALSLDENMRAVSVCSCPSGLCCFFSLFLAIPCARASDLGTEAAVAKSCSERRMRLARSRPSLRLDLRRQDMMERLQIPRHDYVNWPHVFCSMTLEEE